jgi:hypothetical protein
MRTCALLVSALVACAAAFAVDAAVDVDAFPDPRDFLLSPPAAPTPVAFALSNTLGDHMVLQRDKPATVWGFAPVGATVKTLFNAVSYTSTAGADTVWRQVLPATPASAVGTTITFTASTGGTVALADVLFGDVYVCGGQSK